MKIKATTLAIAVAIGCGLAATQAQAITINFDDLAPGTTLSNQYAALGVVFSANAFSGAGTSSSGERWATNTDMTVVSLAGIDVSGVGSPSLVGGNVLRSVNGWLNEDGDASVLMSFSTPMTSVSVTFAGVGTPADVRLLTAGGQVLAAGSTMGQFVLTYSSSTAFSSIAMTPGSFTDWVAVDSTTVTPVPEAGKSAMLAAV